MPKIIYSFSFIVISFFFLLFKKCSKVYQNLSEKEKEKRPKKRLRTDIKISLKKKNKKKVEYMRNHYLAHKNNF